MEKLVYTNVIFVTGYVSSTRFGLKKRDERYQRAVKLINLKQTDNAMAKNEKDKQTTAHMTQHRKPKNKQHEPHQKTRGDLRFNSCEMIFFLVLVSCFC